MGKSNISRRKFLSKAATAGIAGVVVPSIITSCKGGSKKAVTVPTVPDTAPDGPVLRAGVIGCGGRGTGAAMNFLDAGANLQIVALGDIFQDRIDSCKASILKDKGQEVPAENCFLGFDAFRKVIDSGVDVVILATPPFFRPEHLSAAIEARKHVFAEKPVCVDPVGARSVMASGKKAEGMELCIVTGTQRRHKRDYIAAWAKIQEGAIGQITGAECYWNGRKLWHRDPAKEWSEMEYMIRDWVNWSWLSGDHIVEQHVHNLDVINWFTGSHPVKAVGFGSRQRRVTGDQFDNFSIDYEFENGMHLHSMCRQINGCANLVAERTHGSLGTLFTNDNSVVTIHDLKGKLVWQYEDYIIEENDRKGVKVNPYVQEHVDLVTAIRTGKPINEAENTAISTLGAIMGRLSAYTGKEVTWDEMMNSDLKLGPKVFEFGPVDVPKEVPVAGEAFKPKG